MVSLILFRGLPGAGKTTVANMLCNFTVAADDYRVDNEGNYIYNPSDNKKVHALCLKRTEQMILGFMSHGEGDFTIGVHNTFTQEWEMEPYYKLARTYNIPIYSVIVENRHKGESVHNVPEPEIERLRERMVVKL